VPSIKRSRKQPSNSGAAISTVVFKKSILPTSVNI
jgi:hypothetical protein